MSYIIVGSAVLYYRNSDESFNSSEIATYVSRGSFASLYLISLFSTLLSLAESLSEIFGLSERISNLLLLTSSSHGDCTYATSMHGLFQTYKLNLFRHKVEAFQSPQDPDFLDQSTQVSSQQSLKKTNCSRFLSSLYLGFNKDLTTDDLVYCPLSSGDIEIGRTPEMVNLPELPGHHPTLGLSGDAILKVENLDVRNPSGCLIESLSFVVSNGDRLLITGPVGCGKRYLGCNFHVIF